MKTTREEDIYIHRCEVERNILRKRLAELTYEKIAADLDISKVHVWRIAKGYAHKKRNGAIKAETHKAMVVAS